MYIIEWNNIFIYINDTQTTYYIFKVKYESILIEYYKSHGVGIRVI